MILRFSVLVDVIRQRNADITSVVTGAIPGSAVSFDAGVGLVFVHLPTGIDPAPAVECVREALLRAGIVATPYYGQPVGGNNPPVAPAAPKKRRTVPLSVFLASLISVVLVFSVLTVVLTSAFSGSFPGWRFGLTDETLGTGDQKGEDYAAKIALIDSIFEEYSLYDTEGKLLLDEMLKAYAAATGDAYAAYYTEEEYLAMVSENNATVVGIGITALEDAEHHDILVIDVLPDSPAMEAGVKSGDRIVAIGKGEDTVLVSEIGYNAAVNRLRGEAGSTAEFTVVREGAEIAFSVVRAAVQTRSVTGRVSESDATVGYVRITQFDTVTPVQFKEVMNELIGKGCTKFVYDVRNNPGGDLKSISAVLSYFLNAGDTILSTVKKDGTTTVYPVKSVAYTGDYAGCSVKTEEIGMYRNYAKVVLTNGNTASAAELFTAALKDYKLATIVGLTTYGKGVLQNIYHLAPYGYTGAVKLTTGYYSPPSGVNYDGVGIVPDKEIALSDEVAGKSLYLLTEAEDTQLQEAIKIFETN